jgi:hypothetical protein
MHMVKAISILLGLGLVVLTVAGWATSGAALWLSWFDLVGTLGAFWVAGIAEGVIRASVAIALGVGLMVLWIIALSTVGIPEWQSWWTFGFGFAFIVTGVADYFSEKHHTAPPAQHHA